MFDDHTEVNLKLHISGTDFQALMGAVKSRIDSLSEASAERESLMGIYDSLQPYAVLCD